MLSSVVEPCDATTSYKPLRSKARNDTGKVHIANTSITWSNLHKHINWLNTTLIIIIPIIGFISAYWVPLQLYTAIFAVFYYFTTGMGITAGKTLPVEAPRPYMTYNGFVGFLYATERC